MAIDINTPELIAYSEAVEYNATKKINGIFNNDGEKRALILFRSIFRNAKDKISVVARDLNNCLTNDAEYISAIKMFLDNPNSKIQILLSQYNDTNSELFALLKRYAHKISIKIIRDDRTFKNGNGQTVHFCVADSHIYRLEYDIEKRKAECNFNDPRECLKLQKAFDSVFNDYNLCVPQKLA